MTAPKREQFANNTSSLLNGSIDDTVTTLTVVTGSNFPSTGNFRILIDDELLICTARSSSTLTVIRGAEGTVAASHADGANVTLTLTAGGMTQWAADNVAGWGNSPPLGLISDGAGGILTASSFTWVNQGTSTRTDQHGTILLRIPPNGSENVRALVKSAPSAPYSVVAAIQAWNIHEGVFNCGLCFRKNSDGKLHAFGFSHDGTGPLRFSIYNFTDATTFSSTVYTRSDSLQIGEFLWLKMEDDNTDLNFSVSYDGVEWLEIASVGRTSFMSGGPDEIGIYVNNPGSSVHDSSMRLAHWSTF